MLNMVPPLIMNLVTDMCIMAIPAPVVIPIKTSLWKRIGLLLLFSAGIFIMIAAILRVTMVLVVRFLRRRSGMQHPRSVGRFEN
jgi:Na+/H+ antiporter NhaD/arsenite permease-like protein